MMDFNTSFGAVPFDILTFLPNETSKAFSVWSLQDEITEGIECLYFTLEPVDEFVNVPYDNETVTVCIEDDDRKYNENLALTCIHNNFFCSLQRYKWNLPQTVQLSVKIMDYVTLW